MFYCQDSVYFDGWGPHAYYLLDQRTPGIEAGLRHMTAEELRKTWWRLISEYSKLDLAVSSDKLPAISAIAKVFGPAISGTETGCGSYKAGLWEQHLPENLLWYTRNPKRVRPAYRAPSWSWVSIDSCINASTDAYDYGSIIIPEAINVQNVVVKSTSCTIKLASSEAPFGQVTSGCLRIEAPMTEINVTGALSFDKYEFDNGTRIDTYYDISPLTSDDVECSSSFHLLLIYFESPTRWGPPDDVYMKGLILSATEESDVYSRVGYFRTNDPPPYWSRFDHRNYFRMTKVTIV